MEGDPAKAADLAAPGVEDWQGDYGAPDPLVAALLGTEPLMFISNADVMNRDVEHNNVVDAARAANVRRVVYTSFVGAVIDLNLGPGHLHTEKALK